MRMLPKPIKPLDLGHSLTMGNIVPLFYHDNVGRTVNSSREPINGVDTTPPNYNVTSREVEVETDEEAEEEAAEVLEVEDKGPTEPLQVEKINLLIFDNTHKHQTEEYEITQPPEEGVPPRKRKLVIRRGKVFRIKLKTDRAYDPDHDTVELVLETGDNPKTSKGTKVELDIETGLIPKKWGATVESKSKNSLFVIIQPRPDCIVGKWRLSVETLLKDTKEGEKPVIQRQRYNEPIYILFNPWCPEDQVYMNEEFERDEYVLNESGRIFSGNKKQISFKPWAYEQFDEIVLDCALFLLDKSGIRDKVRADAAQVCRRISALVNSPDDGGVLVGNWSGNYEGGTKPMTWVGSLPILEEFWETKSPVKYGQCWVYAGVTTTLCRALGLPCRPVTNFASAHDCDGSITIDVHWDVDGEPIKHLNSDSVWNFHVWNECWMKRPDLRFGYGYDGWQAFDATPQETSGGIYCAGPASVKAIREGYANYPHDAGFIFAEVNADKVHWVMQKNKKWRKVFQKACVGHKISTKWPRLAPEQKNPHWWDITFDEWRHDVTDEYKFKEGSEKEREAVYRANSKSTRANIYDKQVNDVDFELVMKDGILVGKDFDVTFMMRNKSREERHVHVKLTLDTNFYTGVPYSRMRHEQFDVTIPSIQDREVSFKVVADEYLQLMTEQIGFQINVKADVAETDQLFADTEDYRLRRPDLILETRPRSVTAGETFNLIIRLESPMPIHLTDCEWFIEGAGLIKATKLKQKDLEPYEHVSVSVPITPKKAGKDRQINASFTTKQLTDIKGFTYIDVKKAE